MARFQFSLDAVLRLRNHTRDECRRQLALAVARLREIEAQHRRVLDEQAELRNYLKELSQGGNVEVGMVSRCHMHLAQLERRNQEALLACRDAEVIVEAHRRKLVEADQQVRALEKLREKRFEEFQREEDRRELLEQTEIQAGFRHRKRHS